jgi:hypothetical protein
MKRSAIKEFRHEKGNFLLKIYYTQKNDIQGQLQWLEEEKTVNFRSFMELTMLLSEAIGLMDDGPVYRSLEHLQESGGNTTALNRPDKRQAK